jgi:hypothetical protein
MADLDAVADWVGLTASVREAANVAFGALTLLRSVVLIPRSAWDQAVTTLRVFEQVAQVAGETAQPPIERPPRAVELGQVESLRRVCRMRLGLPATEVEPGQAAARAPDAGSGPAGASVYIHITHLRSVTLTSDDGTGTKPHGGKGAGHQRAPEVVKKHVIKKKWRLPAAHDPPTRGPPGPQRSQPKDVDKGKGKSDKKGLEGKHRLDNAGTEICWNWNRAANGCATKCESGRAHICEICRGDHRTVQCPTVGREQDQ